MRIAFIGLGAMGLPMAENLQRAGHALTVVRRRSGPPQSLLDHGAVACATVGEVVAAAEVVILMLPNTPDVEAVLFGEAGVAAALSPGKAVIDMSSIDPLATRNFARRIGELGCDYVDAPVSGGVVGAQNASLTIMCGAQPVAFERVKPVLQAMGSSITHVGAVGDGQIAKLANQIIVALNIQAVAEALTFAAKAGADAARVREALLGGFAGSKVLEVHGRRMLERTFQPGFRIELHQKDLQNALDCARGLRMPLPGAAAAQQIFNVCLAEGGAGWDHSAAIRAFERMAEGAGGAAAQPAASS